LKNDKYNELQNFPHSPHDNGIKSVFLLHGYDYEQFGTECIIVAYFSPMICTFK